MRGSEALAVLASTGAQAAGDAAQASGGSLVLLIVLVFFLVLVNAAFAGSETALVSLREGQLSKLEERGGAGVVLAALARDPNRFLSTVQIGITLAGFLAAGSATTALATPLAEVLAFLGGAARPVAIFLVTLALTFLTLVLGELAPKRIALQRAEGWGLAVARPLALLGRVSAPAVWVLTKATDVVVRLAGGDPDVTREEVSAEELRDLVTAQAMFSQEQREIIEGAFEVAERTLREILVPRPNVLAFDVESKVFDVIGTLVASGHSRAPVYRGDLDDITGIVHLRDLVAVEDSNLEGLTRPAIVLPETVGVLDALQRLRAQREQVAIVINEHGGTEGIVTLEDLLEEIVGEIYDEFDLDLDPTDPEGVVRRDDGSISLPGSFPMHDLTDLGVRLPEGEHATVAGLVLRELGRIPSTGEEVHVPGWRIVVTERLRNAIGRVVLVPDPAEGEGDGIEDPSTAPTGR